MTDQEQRDEQLDRVAPADRDTARRVPPERTNASDDPVENLDRAFETGAENPV